MQRKRDNNPVRKMAQKMDRAQEELEDIVRMHKALGDSMTEVELTDCCEEAQAILAAAQDLVAVACDNPAPGGE